MTLQRNVLELYAIHDKYSKKEVVTRVPGKKDEIKLESREDDEIYFDVWKKEEFREIPKQLESYLNSAGTLIEGSFYGMRDSGEHKFTYHIGGSTVKLGISPLKAGRDINDYEGTDWAVFGYKFSAELVGSDSKKVQEELSGKLKSLGFEMVDEKQFSDSGDHYVGF